MDIRETARLRKLSGRRPRWGEPGEEIIGRGGLSLARTENGPQLELGWAVREQYWGQGYATEIGNAGLAFAFDELDADHVISFTERHNARSRAVMVRLGFTFSGHVTHNG